MTILSEKVSQAVQDVEGEVQNCLVCFDELTGGNATKTPCGHDDVCGECHLRLRFLHNDKKCPVCKTENELVIVDHANKTFDEYPVWGGELGPNFREVAGMLVEKSAFESRIRHLLSYGCTVPTCGYTGKEPEKNMYEDLGEGNQNKPKVHTPLRGLQDHLRNKHRLALCQLCVDHQRDFVSKLPRFTPAKLKQHLSKGDGEGSAFRGHPLCEFCRPTRFYDLTYLHQHLNKEHYKCHVCEKQGLANQFFKNYKSLEKHFDQRHFVCHDSQCLRARFVVFENELDLRHHERQVHGGTSARYNKIQFEFRVRRNAAEPDDQEVPSDNDFNYGLNGQAFVPADLPQSQGINLHPQHVLRTEELRVQAAALRDESETQEEAFPTLSETVEGTQSYQELQMGWTTGTVSERIVKKKHAGIVTDEDFPSLPTAVPSRGQALAHLRPQRGTATTACPGWSDDTSIPSTTAQKPSATPLFVTTPRPTARNSQQNLTSDNFPSLGPSAAPRPARYTTASVLARQKGGSKPSPSWNNQSDFPPPPKASLKSSKVRDKLLGDTSIRSAPHAAQANILQIPPMVTGKKKAAWGASGQTTAVRSSQTAPAYSVSAQIQQNHGSTKSKSKKKKKNKGDYQLRQLAFG